MARLNQTLLQKVADRLGKTPKYIREQVSRRASREGVASAAALVMWARDLGIGVASALEKLPPHVQQQLSMPRVVAPRPVRAVSRKPGAARPRMTARGRRPARGSKGKAIFISHAGEDKKLAAALVELLRSAFNMEANNILCTSVDGYRLPAGSDTDEALRSAVLACKTLVGIISPASRKSAYVLNELGARWATRKHLVPVTAGGVAPGELGGPVGKLNALNLSSRPSVLQLIGDLATELKVETERSEVFDGHVDRVVRASKAAGKSSKRRRKQRGKSG
jgi:hypothetical protein